MLIFCLGSFLLQDMFLALLALESQSLKYSVNMLLTCILYCDAGPGCLIRTVASTVCQCMLLLVTDIIFIFVGLRSRKHCLRDVLMFLASISSSFLSLKLDV